MVQEAPPEVKAALAKEREETENKGWYLVKAPTSSVIEARVDGVFSAKDLRIIANRIDLHNQVPLDS